MIYFAVHVQTTAYWDAYPYAYVYKYKSDLVY